MLDSGDGRTLAVAQCRTHSVVDDILDKGRNLKPVTVGIGPTKDNSRIGRSGQKRH